MSVPTRQLLEVRTVSHRLEDRLQVQQPFNGVSVTVAERVDLSASGWRRQKRAIEAALSVVSFPSDFHQVFNKF